MTNYPKDEESSFNKEKKTMSISFFEENFVLQKSIKFTKEKLGGANFKTPPFCNRWTNFTKFCNYKLGEVKTV